MADDPLTAMLAAIDQRADEDTTSLDEARRERTADSNHPLKPAVTRGPRQRTYRDPTGGDAAGNVDREAKDKR